MFVSTLDELTAVQTDQKFFRSKNHDMFLINTNKTALSAYYDKRHVLSDNISTLAFGHKDIPKN